METAHPPHQPDPPQPQPPPARQYYHLLHTLIRGLPPPADDTPEASLARNQSAIDQVAAMLPTNANEAALAAQCVAARAQADDVMQSIRTHTGGDDKVRMRLNAQYAAMIRASQGAHGHLLRAQAMRYRREQSDAALKADEWTQYFVTRTLEQALEVSPEPAMRLAGQSPPAPTAAPEAAAPAPTAPDPAIPGFVASAPTAVAPPPPPVLAVAAPPAPVAASAVPPRAPTQAAPAPASPRHAEPPRRSRGTSMPAQPSNPPRELHVDADDLPRDLQAEADYYAAVYPDRARAIRRYGGLPPNCSFGPPDNGLVRALLTHNSPALRDLDSVSAAAD